MALSFKSSLYIFRDKRSNVNILTTTDGSIITKILKQSNLDDFHLGAVICIPKDESEEKFSVKKRITDFRARTNETELDYGSSVVVGKEYPYKDYIIFFLEDS